MGDSVAGVSSVAATVPRRPDLAQTKSRSGATRAAVPKTAVAIVSLRMGVRRCCIRPTPHDWLDARQRIEELFARHPDHDLFGSLPGAGPKIAPRLLSEIGDDRQRFGVDPQNLHANPLRRLSHRWLKIIYKMWIDRTPYNAELHHRNQLQHGCWIFQLQQS